MAIHYLGQVESLVSLRKTPLHAAHVALGARMVGFGGWEMPVQYTSILQEHLAVRKAAGLFDISHMGEFRVSGAGAVEFLNFALTNNLNRVAIGGSQYTLLLNEQGGVLDDLFVYRIGKDEFLMVVNASRIEEDFAALSDRKKGSVSLRNESAETAALALQGPASAEILDRWLEQKASSQLGHHEIRAFHSPAGPVQIGRTGYTGEDGFEILGSAAIATEIWRQILEAGKPNGLLPCGLGARDTLRLEVCYPLYGHELGEDITPLEAGLGIFVDLTKADFVGKKALLTQKTQGIPRQSIGLTSKPGSPPPRAGYGVFHNQKRIGSVTSGTQSPSLQKGIALALVEKGQVTAGNSVDIEIRGKYFAAEVVKKPIYRKNQ